MSRLSERQENFCQNVVTGGMSEHAAYADAFGCAPASARTSASRLMTQPDVIKRIDKLRLMAASPEREQIKELVTKEVTEAVVEALTNSEEVQHIINGTVTKLARLSATLLTTAERRSFLAMVVRTPIADIDDTSPLAQSVEYELKGAGRDKEGRMVMKVKTPDKIRASELDAKMAGELIESGTTVNVVENKAITVIMPAAIAQPRNCRVIGEAE